MSKDLSLRVIFSALDKLTGPLKAMSNASKRLTGDMRGTTSEIRKLQGLQSAVTKFRELKSGVEATRTEMTAAAAKAKELGRAIGTAENPTKAMEREFKKARKAAEELQRKFQEQNAELNKTRDSLRKAGISTTDLAAQQRDLAGKVEAANKQLASQKSRLADIGKAHKNAEKLKGAGSSISGAGLTTSLAVSTPIAAVAGSSFKTAMDFNEMASAFDVTFGKYAASARQWAEQTGDQLHRSTAEMMAMAMSYQDILGKQMDPGKAVQLSKTLTVLTQDLASFKNLSNESAKEKIFSGLIGESEPLRAVGVLLSEQLVKAKALQMGFKPIGKGDFSEGDKVLARAQLIQEQLTNANGDVVRTQGSTANQIKAASGAWDEMQLSVGKFLLALTPLITNLTVLIEAFNTLSPDLQYVITWGAVAAAALGPVLVAIGTMVTLFGGLTGVAATLGIGIAPLLGTIAAVAVGVGGAAYLIYQNWDWLMKKMQPLFDAIKGVWNELVNAFQNTWIGDALRGLANVVASALGGTFLAVIETVVGVVTGAFDVIGGAIKVVVGLLTGDFGKAWEGLEQMFKGGLNALVAILEGVGKTFASIGISIVNGLINGITGAWDGLVKRWYGLVDMLPTSFKSLLNINSPSRVFMALGGGVTEGLAMGLDRGGKRPLASMRAVAAGVVGAGAMSLAAPSLASTGSVARGGGGVTIGSINITQQPAEDANALVERIMRRIRQEEARARRSGYQDDL